jgi:hypothetical protein
MPRSNRLLAALLGCFAMGSVGCSLTIDEIFAMQPGSGVDVSIIAYGSGQEVPQGRLAFEGGTVMRIDVSTSLLDYLDGTVDGEVQILDLLFAVPSFTFLIFDAGLTCVVPDNPVGGGSFSYNALAQEATFDVIVNTKALITNAVFATMVRGGAFQFPFHLVATMPLTLLDALGLFTGTGSLTVTQPIDGFYTVPMVQVANDPSQDYPMPIHVQGEVTLQTTDTFPVTPGVTGCLDFLAGT